MSFKDKVVIVTGSSSGIGAAIAKEFTKEGAKVTIIGRDQTKLTNVAAEVTKLGSSPLVIKADISKTDDLRKIVNETVKKFGKIDILVNNAGIVKDASIKDEKFIEVFDEVMNTNLRGAVYLSHLAAPYLAKTKGNIINISSIAALRVIGFSVLLPYATSKAGMDHFTRCLAKELAPDGIRVNSINVGPVKTDILRTCGFENDEQIWEDLKKTNVLERWSEPEEIAYVVLFLANDKAKGITGSGVLTDNGSMVL